MNFHTSPREQGSLAALFQLRKLYRYAILRWMRATSFHSSDIWFDRAERFARLLRIEEATHRVQI